MASSLAPYLSSALWSDWFDAGILQLGQTAFWLAVLQIIFINIVLSGDNALVIAMACRGLPMPQRLWGMIIGAGIAVILRIAFTSIIAQLLLLPYLKLFGGLALFYIAAKIVVPDDDDKDEVAALTHLWRVIGIIVLADAVMSLDNVIAIAATANGNMLLLVIGLVVSIPIILAGAASFSALLDRFPILIWAGAALLGWIAGQVIVGDPTIAGRLSMFGENLARHVDLAATCAGAMLAVAAGGLWRRLHDMKVRAQTVRQRARGA